MTDVVQGISTPIHVFLFHTTVFQCIRYDGIITTCHCDSQLEHIHVHIRTLWHNENTFEHRYNSFRHARGHGKRGQVFTGSGPEKMGFRLTFSTNGCDDTSFSLYICILDVDDCFFVQIFGCLFCVIRPSYDLIQLFYV